MDFAERGTTVDIYQFRHLIKNSLMFANGDYSPEEAEETVAAGKADAIIIGRCVRCCPRWRSSVRQLLGCNNLNFKFKFRQLSATCFTR